MIHVLDSGVDTSTNMKRRSVGWSRRILAVFAVVMTMFFMAKPAAAQPFGSTLQTWVDALNGNFAARSLIASDTGLLCDDGFGNYTVPCPDPILNEIIAQLGGTSAAAIALLNQAIGGDTAALNTIQGAFGGLYFANIWTFYDTWGNPLPPQPNIYDDYMNTVIAGSGNIGLLTLIQSYSGNANANDVLNYLFTIDRNGDFFQEYSNIWTNPFNPPSVATMQSLFRSSTGAGTNAAMIAILQSAIDGNATDRENIVIALNNMMTNYFNLQDAATTGFLSNLINSLGGPPVMPDMDGDGIPDVNDPDIDGDGISNSIDTDDDNDGIPDDMETDTDDDGIPDGNDPDIDGDGTPNDQDTDDDGDGTPDWQDPDIDTDGDGTPDINDDDDDNDGTPDTSDTDADGDGVDDETDPDSGNNTSNTGDPTTSCGDEQAPLTGSFAEDPCELTRDARSGEMTAQCYNGMDANCNIQWETCNYAEDHQAGEQFAAYLRDWWSCQYLPAMRNQTKQLHASVIDQTGQMQKNIDSINMSRTTREVQGKEHENKINLLPNELTCVAGSHSAALATTSAAANALSQGFKNDAETRRGGAPGTPAEHGPAADLAFRFGQYCEFFNNPDANNGENACPNPATAGPLVDGDISIEEFLFKDTIDFNVEVNRKAAEAIVDNIVNPMVWEQIPASVEESATLKEIVLKREYFESIRKTVTEVITSMLSRRAGIPLPTTAGGTQPGPPPPPAGPAPAPTPVPGGRTYDDFLNALGQRESGGGGAACRYGPGTGAGYVCVNYVNFLGKYQFGRDALYDIGCITNLPPNLPGYVNNINAYTWSGTCGGVGGINSVQAFLNSGPAQEGAIRAYMTRQRNYISSPAVCGGQSCWTAGMCQTIGGIVLSPTAMLAGAHLVGHVAMKAFISSGGTDVRRDGSGTPITQYLQLFSGYDGGPHGGDCGSTPMAGPTPGAPPAPPRPVGDTVREIRERAGVNPADIATNPSYNEIMQAMTKERFFDPQYFVKINNSLAAIKQEQTSINSFIAVQMMDIENMQERINMLLAARASLQYNSEKIDNKTEHAPVR